jgi:hypothetical protein
MNDYDRFLSRRRILMSGAFAATGLMLPIDDQACSPETRPGGWR